MSSYDSPANVAKYSGVQGSPNQRAAEAKRQRQRGKGLQPEHVAGVRKVLRAHGYQVDATGPITDRLLSAWRNYRRGIQYGTGRGRGTGDNAQPGAHTVKEWNNLNPRKYGASSGALHKVVTSPPADSSAIARANQRTKTHDKAAVHAAALGVKGHKSGSGKGGGVPGVGGPGIAAGVNKLLPSSYAETVAAAQFDPQIAEARRALSGQKRDEAQAQADIGNWYGQVQGSQKEAAAADASAGSRARSDVASMIQAITGSLGERGGALVGATGANDLSALAAQGQNQDKYNAELAPILGTARADAAARQQAMASQADIKAQGAINDLLSSRGLTKTKAMGDILQANNQSRQQNFSNRLALNNAALAAESMGLDVAKTRAQLAAYGLDSQIKRAGLKQAKQKASGHPNWMTLDPVARENYANHAVSTAITQLYGSNPSAIDSEAVGNAARAILRTYGFGSARSRAYKGRVPSRQAQGQILGALNTAITTAAGKYNQ